MPSSVINSDDGVISGTSGLKSTGGDDGVLNIQNNGTTAISVASDGDVGIGTTSPVARLNILGDFGQQLVLQDTVSNSTNKGATFTGGHYTNTEEPVLVAGSFSSSTGNTCYYGGGWTAGNSATELRFYTAANTTTVTGTERMRITSGGDLQFNSGYGSVATAYGCRAWVNFNGGGTVAINASGNVSSITDNGTGDYTVNFTTAMPDVNYSISCGRNDYSPSLAFSLRYASYKNGTISTGSFGILTGYVNSNGVGVAEDGSPIFASVFR